jgi:hypothetical protein
MMNETLIGCDLWSSVEYIHDHYLTTGCVYEFMMFSFLCMTVVKFSISTAGICLCVALKRCFSIQSHKYTRVPIYDKEILRDEINLIFWENTAYRYKAMYHKNKNKNI